MMLIRFVATAQQLKILIITSFTVPTLQLQEIPLIDQDEIKIIQTFFSGNPTYFVNDNKLIFDSSEQYILETEKFNGPILLVKESWSMHNCQNRIA